MLLRLNLLLTVPRVRLYIIFATCSLFGDSAFYALGWLPQLRCRHFLPTVNGADRDEAISQVLAGQQAISVLVGELVYQVTPPVEAGDEGLAPKGNAWDIDFIVVLPNAYAISSQPTNGEEIDWYTSDGVQQWKASQWAPDEAPDADPPKPVTAGDDGLAKVSRFLALDAAALSEDFAVDLAPVIDEKSEKLPAMFSICSHCNRMKRSTCNGCR